MEKKVTTAYIRQCKKKQTPITMLTAYDYPSAKLIDEAGIDMILVGDSLGMVILGYESTIPVTMDDMVHHTRAVVRGTKRAMVVADMPFLSTQISIEEGLRNAGRLMQAGATAIKIEGAGDMTALIELCVKAGIPVMGHIGLTPQSVHQLGGFKVQGKDIEAAQKLIADAQALEKAGVFALIIECVPGEVAKHITKSVDIPTIGIGAGIHCDGQVLVFHDMLGYGSDLQPRFIKSYAQIGNTIKDAVTEFIHDVNAKKFPDKEHTY